MELTDNEKKIMDVLLDNIAYSNKDIARAITTDKNNFENVLKNISRYLKVLESKGFINRRKEGRTTYNSMTKKYNKIVNPKVDPDPQEKIQKEILPGSPVKKTDKPIKKTPKKREKKGLSNLESKMLLDEFKQIKEYFRKGVRPAQTIAINNFEKHLSEILKI